MVIGWYRLVDILTSMSTSRMVFPTSITYSDTIYPIFLPMLLSSTTIAHHYRSLGSTSLTFRSSFILLIHIITSSGTAN